MEAASRFRIVLADPGEADAFERIQPDGELLPLFVEVEGHAISTGQVAIVEGRSGVVQAAGGPLTLKLSKGGAEVRRVELVLAPGGVLDLRP